MLDTIGHTPLVELRRVVPEGCARILVKLESHNPTGSMKDRMARAVVAGAVQRGALGPHDRVIEYTGGSTGTPCEPAQQPRQQGVASCDWRPTFHLVTAACRFLLGSRLSFWRATRLQTTSKAICRHLMQYL